MLREGREILKCLASSLGEGENITQESDEGGNKGRLSYRVEESEPICWISIGVNWSLLAIWSLGHFRFIAHIVLWVCQLSNASYCTLLKHLNVLLLMHSVVSHWTMEEQKQTNSSQQFQFIIFTLTAECQQEMQETLLRVFFSFFFFLKGWLFCLCFSDI